MGSTIRYMRANGMQPYCVGIRSKNKPLMVAHAYFARLPVGSMNIQVITGLLILRGGIGTVEAKLPGWHGLAHAFFIKIFF